MHGDEASLLVRFHVHPGTPSVSEDFVLDVYARLFVLAQCIAEPFCRFALFFCHRFLDTDPCHYVREPCIFVGNRVSHLDRQDHEMASILSLTSAALMIGTTLNWPRSFHAYGDEPSILHSPLVHTQADTMRSPSGLLSSRAGSVPMFQTESLVGFIKLPHHPFSLPQSHTNLCWSDFGLSEYRPQYEHLAYAPSS